MPPDLEYLWTRKCAQWDEGKISTEQLMRIARTVFHFQPMQKHVLNAIEQANWNILVISVG